MGITRRQFAVGVGAGLALVTLGCGDEGGGSAVAGDVGTRAKKGKGKKIDLATEPFLIGAGSTYRKAGVYEGFRESKGVVVVSDGKVLVALSVACTHLGCAVQWKEADEMFACPCHKSRFDRGGINEAGVKAKRPLERCSVRVVEKDNGQEVEVDPTRRLREDKGEWSDPAASVQIG